jgi:hypothetical protein
VAGSTAAHFTSSPQQSIARQDCLLWVRANTSQTGAPYRQPRRARIELCSAPPPAYLLEMLIMPACPELRTSHKQTQ